LTRRRFLIAASVSAVAVSGGIVWDRHAIYNFLHPLPSKRFVALLGWPPPPDIRLKPMLLSLIDAMATELSRAEAFDSNFFVTTQQFMTDLKTPTQLNEVRESLGANLVLAASGSTVDKHYLVHLNVLDPESLHVLRSRELRAPIDQQFSLPVQAVHAAAELLGIPSYRTSDRRTQAGTNNVQALSAFQNAQALMKQPNNAGLDAAIEQYKEAVEEDSHYAIAYARLSIAYLRLYTAHRDPSSMTLARANAETAIALDPDAVDGRLALGSVYQMTGNEKEALHQLGLALRVDPADIRTMTYQAQIYSETNQWDEAEQAFKRILKARPNNWVVYNELGNNYYYQGKFPQALEAFRAAATTGPRNAMAYENIGLTYSAMGNLDEAMKAIQKSISLAPMDAAYQAKADLLRYRGQYAEALQASIEATRIDPEESTNWLAVGDSYASLHHRKQEALAAYKKAADAQIAELEVNPDDGPGWMLLALYRAKTGDRITSPTLIKKAESLNAIDVFSQLYKIRTLELLGQRKDALTALAAARRRGLTRYQIEGIHDLDLLRADPKYSAIMAAGPGS
jgi:tetratricopeptide (TPR) repeat protein